MLILLYGEDTFRSQQKLKEIIQEYQAKHSTGLNLVRFREGDLPCTFQKKVQGLDFDKVKEKIEAVSMFDEKKLIILENNNFREEFFEYIKKNKLKDNQDIIIVIYQEGKLTDSAIKRKVNMFEEFKPLEGVNLNNWIKNRALISPVAAKKLAAYVGNDLWQMSNELNKLISYRSNQLITEDDMDLLVRAKIDLNIFKMLDALAQRDKKTALKLLHEHLSQGENEIYLFSMFIYQLRSLLKLKDLIVKGMPFYDLAKKAGLHPFVVKKSSQQLRNFTLDQLKKIYQRLLAIDLSLKKGRIDPSTALDMLVVEI